MRRDSPKPEPQPSSQPDRSSPVERLEIPLLCDLLEEMVFVLDHSGRIIRANRAACEILQYSHEEFLGRRFWELYAPQARGPVEQLIAALSAETGVQSCSLPLQRRDDMLIEAQTRAAAGRLGDRHVVFVTVREVLETEQVIKRLRETEQRYRLVTEHVVDVLFVLHLREPLRMPLPAESGHHVDARELIENWRLTFVTPSVERVLGYSVSEIMELPTTALLTPQTMEIMQWAVAEDLPVALREGTAGFPQRILEMPLVRKDGEVIWTEVSARFAVDEQGRLVGVVGVLRDATERKQARLALEKGQQRFRTVLENLPDFVALLDNQGKILYMNRPSVIAPPSELLGTDGLHTLRPEYRQPGRERTQAALQTGEVQHLQVEDIRGRRLAVRYVPVGDDPATRQVVLIATDITEQYRYEQALLREQRLLRRLLDIHEQERQLTACDVHDGVAQQLVGVRLQLEAFEQLHPTNPQAAAAAFKKALQLLDQGLAEARRVISGARPPILDEQGVVAAVEYLIASLRERCSPQIDFEHSMPETRLPNLLETTIFRIVQEAVTNACRHSQSPKVSIRLIQQDESIHISVRDWGEGFDPQQVSPTRFGLQSIRERARLLGGAAQIDSAPGKGTCVTVELPLIVPQDDASQDEPEG